MISVQRVLDTLNKLGPNYKITSIAQTEKFKHILIELEFTSKVTKSKVEHTIKIYYDNYEESGK